MTQGVDGGPGLSGLVVHTNTSLGLLFPSVFDAMSCKEGNGQCEGLTYEGKAKEKRLTEGQEVEEGKRSKKMSKDGV